MSEASKAYLNATLARIARLMKSGGGEREKNLVEKEAATLAPLADELDKQDREFWAASGAKKEPVQ